MPLPEIAPGLHHVDLIAPLPLDDLPEVQPPRYAELALVLVAQLLQTPDAPLAVDQRPHADHHVDDRPRRPPRPPPVLDGDRQVVQRAGYQVALSFVQSWPCRVVLGYLNRIVIARTALAGHRPATPPPRRRSPQVPALG